jgi:hypothetical protein
VISFTPRPLYPQGKNHWCPLDRRLSGPQNRSGRGGEEKNSQIAPGIEPYNPDRPARIPALYQLSYHGSSSYYCSSQNLSSPLAFFAVICVCILLFPILFTSCFQIVQWKGKNIVVPVLNESSDSSVGIALGYGLEDRGSSVRFPTGAGNFSLHHCVQNGSGARPASYPMGTRGSFPGGKAAGA